MEAAGFFGITCMEANFTGSANHGRSHRLVAFDQNGVMGDTRSTLRRPFGVPVAGECKATRPPSTVEQIKTSFHVGVVYLCNRVTNFEIALFPSSKSFNHQAMVQWKGYSDASLCSTGSRDRFSCW